jgi:hypothetical protein
LDNLLLQRDLFDCEAQYLIWKSAYYSVYGVHTLLKNQIKQKIWEGTQIENPIQQLNKKTTHFVKKIRKSGKTLGRWKTSDPQCCQILKDFQKECKSDIKVLIKNLDKKNPIREDIERKYKNLL